MKKPLLSAAILAAIIAAAPAAQGQATGPATRPAVNLTDPAVLGAMLEDPASGERERDEAATRLLAARTPEALRFLRSALAGSDRNAQIVVARAIALDNRPDPVFIDLLFALLDNRLAAETAAAALVNYRDDPQIFARLADYARAVHRPEPSRLAVLRAMGGLSDRRAAELLVGFAVNEAESSRLRLAATEGLLQMTGLEENNHDPLRWQNWWRQAAAWSEAEWQSRLLVSRARRLDQLRLRHERLNEEVQAILTDQFQSASSVQQPEILLRYLRSAAPGVRATGANIIFTLATTARPVPAAARERLRQMIFDASAETRYETARALRAVNDPAALDALLIQLEREPDDRVREAIAAALAPIGDLRAVPLLLRLLDDPSPRVAEAAADAIGRLGANLRENQPEVAEQAARKLREVLEIRASGPGAIPLREACVEAMVPLRSADLLGVFYRLLRENERPRIRRAALKALGELREPKAADMIVRFLEDPDASVRLQAIVALGQTNAFEHAEALYRRMSAADEPDASVREESWRVLESLFPSLPKDQLSTWAHRFRDEPGRRLTVLKALAAAHLKDKDEEQLALTRQNIGVEHARLNQPADSVTYFKLALDYWRSRHVEDMVTESLIEQYLDALLKSRQYAETVRFGSELIAGKPVYQQTVGATIRAETERLKKSGDTQNALLLIQESRKMNPPLAAQYRDDLNQIEQEIRARG